MICKKERRYKKVYCSADLTDSIILKKEGKLTQAKVNQLDATQKYIKTIPLLAWVKRDNYQTEINGELLDGGSVIRVKAYFLNAPMSESDDTRIYDDISNNQPKWHLEYNGANYKIQDIGRTDNREVYMQIVANRIAKKS